MARALGSLGLRTRLLLAVVLAVTAALAVLLVGLNLVLRARLDSEVTSLLRARTADRVAALATVDGTLSAPESLDAAAFDSSTWIYAGPRTLERPPAAPSVDRAAASLSGGPRRTLDVSSPHTRLLAVPVDQGGRRLGTVVSGVALSPYDRTKTTALFASLAFGALLLAAVTLATRWGLAAALAPVARMTSSAAEWSERDLDRRFGLGPPRDELTQLAATLDGLLDRVAEGLRHERSFTAELSHELRTPLSRITTEAQLAMRARDALEHRPALASVLRSARQMDRTLEALMTAARSEMAAEPQRCDAAVAVAHAVDGVAELARSRGVAIERQELDGPLTVSVSRELLERLLAPLLENACHHASGRVGIEVRRSGDRVRATITDDGPGVDESERERIFEPGVRGSAAAAYGGAGAGLGLALARRLAKAAAAEVVVGPGAGGCFVVWLPRGSQ